MHHFLMSAFDLDIEVNDFTFLSLILYFSTVLYVVATTFGTIKKKDVTKTKKNIIEMHDKHFWKKSHINDCSIHIFNWHD